MDFKIDSGNIENYSINKIVQYIQTVMDSLMKISINEDGLNEEELQKRQNKKERLRNALKNCMFGSRQDKEFVKDFIRDILDGYYGINAKNINYIIPFNSTEELCIPDKFDILLHVFKNNYKHRALTELIKKYKLDALKKIDDMEYFCITAEEIEEAFEKESPQLSFNDKYNLVVQRVYSLYKGYGCIDEILDMQIDGVSGGVSGLPDSFVVDRSEQFEELLSSATKNLPRSYDSIWIFFQGKSLHMRFLSFGSYEELQRICQTIYKFDNPGGLSRLDGYKVNKLKDGSRVVVLRPEFCESWAFFIRKFDIPDASLPALVTDKNWELPVELIKFLVKGSRNTSITGAQGTGKTTLLNSLIEYIYHPYTLRILELSFELHVRKRFPYRNVLTIQETDSISGQLGLDVLKKTDGVVTIVGEVASDPVASYMIQTAQVASKFTLFSHHAKQFPDLVMALRNSLLREGRFSSERIAEEQIVRVLHFDIHLEKDLKGRRYIERITECIPLENSDIPRQYMSIKDGDQRKLAFLDTVYGYFQKMCGGMYTYRNIIEFDSGKGEYVAVNPISERNFKDMLKEMSDEDRSAFKAFTGTYFSNIIRWEDDRC